MLPTGFCYGHNHYDKYDSHNCLQTFLHIDKDMRKMQKNIKRRGTYNLNK